MTAGIDHRSLALSVLYYNWVRIHGTIKTTPAVALGLAKRRGAVHWIAEFAEMYHESAANVARRATADRALRRSVH